MYLSKEFYFFILELIVLEIFAYCTLFLNYFTDNKKVRRKWLKTRNGVPAKLKSNDKLIGPRSCSKVAENSSQIEENKYSIDLLSR
jgi:hypothetical protein